MIGSPAPRPRRRGARDWAESRPPRWLWPALAAPGVAWLVVLFAVPFYAVIALAAGGQDPIFGDATAEWNPLGWNLSTIGDAFSGVFPGGTQWGPMGRTFVYVALAVALCFVLGFPVAYYVARFGGRRKGLLLALLLAPFWISYLMRMLAWVNLLQPDGYVNDALDPLPGFAGVNWLDGRWSTLVVGLTYGYIPFFILPLYAALDRNDTRLLEASRDLGVGPIRTFLHVTLPMSRQGMLAAAVITALPMFGDYYTQDLLSASPRTSMIGNQINLFLRQGSGSQFGSALVLVLSCLLAVLMAYYLWSTNVAARDVR